MYNFFERYAESDWREPVQITLKTKQGKNLIASHLSALDRISNDVMVVLVPIDQIKNTSYKVSEHTFYTICTELHRARVIMKKLSPQSLIKTKKKAETNKQTASDVLDMDALIDKLLAEEEKS